MLIGNNNNGNKFFLNKKMTNNDDFNKNLNSLNQANNKTFDKNIFVEDIKTISHSNPTSRKDMRNKSLAMLQSRLENGLITLEEFNRKCHELDKDKK